MNEEMYGIETDYNSIMMMVDGDSLTASLFEYLRYKKLNVVKASMPVVKYNDEVVHMKSYKLIVSNDMKDVFGDVYRMITEMNPKIVILYKIKNNYNFSKKIGVDEMEIEPTLKYSRVVRLGVISNE